MSSLVEKALQYPSRQQRDTDVTDDHIDLAVAWLSGRVTIAQFGVALGLKPKSSTSCGYTVARIIRAAYQRGRIVDTLKAQS